MSSLSLVVQFKVLQHNVYNINFYSLCTHNTLKLMSVCHNTVIGIFVAY